MSNNTTKRKEQILKKGNHVPYGIYEVFFKRPFDLIISCIALVLLSPVMLIIALLVRFMLGSPVLFTQERAGMIDHLTGKEKLFKLYKFRTMMDKRDEKGDLLPDEERLTKFGCMLRSTSLDELPELFNIIRGDMSIVGPRPLLVKYIDRYTPEQRRRHEVKPGLTGLAASTVRNSEGWDRKLELDIEYVDRVSFLMDLKIIYHTFIIVIKREGINESGSTTNSEFMGSLENKR